MGRSKFISAPKKVMSHGEFINRICKTLYYGVSGENCNSKSTNMDISRPLAEYAADLFSEPHRGHSLNRLTRVGAGKIHATPCSLIMALIYLDRLNVVDPGYVRRITPQELFVVSLMISTKLYAGHEEIDFYLTDWAKEGNMSEDKLKSSELDFLIAIDWDIYISNEQFFAKLNNIENVLARREGLRRGWLTYTELIRLLPSFAIIKFLLNSFTIMVVSYAASVITIAGAFFIASQIPGTILYRKHPTAATNTIAQESQMNTTNVPASMPNVMDDASHAMPVINETLGLSTLSTIPINANCSARNVEVEFMKLEQQYCEEAHQSELLTAVNIDAIVNQLPLMEGSLQQYCKTDDSTNNWLAWKHEYSNDNSIMIRCVNYHNDFQYVRNVSTFWQVLNCFMEQTYELLPILWSKFI